MDDKETVRVIKRYTNRKLYDTEDSRYVTLDEIAGMVKAGQEVRIVDNRSGEDLTEVTLAQILFEEQKKQSTRMPLDLLKNLIATSGETISEFIQRKVTQPVQSFREGAERTVDEIRKRGENTVEDTGRQIKDFLNSTQRSLDDLHKRFDDRVQGVLANMPGVRSQLRAMRQRIEELEARLTPPGEDPPAEDLPAEDDRDPSV
jgi:polyhydroxyalkanoate synthesis repressor PhaR